MLLSRNWILNGVLRLLCERTWGSRRPLVRRQLQSRGWGLMTALATVELPESVRSDSMRHVLGGRNDSFCWWLGCRA